MNTFSFKLPDDMYGALAAEARRRNVTRSVLVREMIDQALRYDACAAPPNCAQLAGDLVGAFRSGRRRAPATRGPKEGGGSVSCDSRRTGGARGR